MTSRAARASTPGKICAKLKEMIDAGKTGAAAVRDILGTAT